MEILKAFIKRKFVILLAAIVLVFFVLFNAGFFGGKDERIRITCVGDSITYGSGVLKTREIDSYPAQLQKKLGTDHIVYNYGLRNATASAKGDLPYIESEEYKESLKSKPNIVILMLGTNDTKLANWDEAEYKNGLKTLVQSYLDLETKPTVYLMKSPYAFSEEGTEEAAYGVYPGLIKDQIGSIVDEVATETGVEVIDLYWATEGEDELYTDGIHFNAQGYHLISQIVYEYIKK